MDYQLAPELTVARERKTMKFQLPHSWIAMGALVGAGSFLVTPAYPDVALANFCGDSHPLSVSLKLASGESMKLGDFTSGQVTGFLAFENRPTDLTFTHPQLGTKTFTLKPTNTPHFLVFAQIRKTNAPSQEAVPSLVIQKWPVNVGQGKGYWAVNLCELPVSFLVDQTKKVQCPPSIKQFEAVKISSAQSVTVARTDGSEPVSYTPEEPAPYLIIFYPTTGPKNFGWTSQPIPSP